MGGAVGPAADAGKAAVRSKPSADDANFVIDMTDNFDLTAYLARIGYQGPVAPDLATLRAIVAAQPAAIPFENLDPLLGRPPRLDVDSLQAKLVGEHRGGYCFELNTLLAAALDRIGFSVTRLAARVRWMAPPDRPESARTHMLLAVDLPHEGRYLADAGFGGLLLARPLRFMPDEEQRAQSSTMRLLQAGAIYTLQVLLPTGWQDCYRFTLEPQLPIDYIVANWYTATLPTSLFVTNLLMQRLTATGHATLFNTRFSERDFDGTLREREVPDPATLGELLETVFAITPPEDVGAIWSRLPRP